MKSQVSNPADLGLCKLDTKSKGASPEDLENPFKCGYCYARFGNLSKYAKHMKKHSQSKKPFECRHCGKTFTLQINLTDHLEICTPASTAPAPTYKKKEETVNYRVSDNGYSDQNYSNNAAIHTNSSNAPQYTQSSPTVAKTHECGYCSKKFASKIILNLHLKTHTVGVDKPHGCSYCDKKFASKNNLNLHMKTHNIETERPFECDFCTEAFSTQNQLNVHRQIHTGEKLWKCVPCGKDFTKKDVYKAHLKRHFDKNDMPGLLKNLTSKNPYKCNYCGKDFSTPKSLQNHVKTHSGEKRFKCNFCDKVFKEHGNFRVHMKTHSGERPWQCTECGIDFACQTTYDRHKKMHKKGDAPTKLLDKELSAEDEFAESLLISNPPKILNNLHHRQAEALRSQSIQSQPTNLIQSEPTNLIQSEPTNLIQSEPTNLIQSEPTNLIQSEPTNLIQSQPTNLIQSAKRIQSNIVSTNQQQQQHQQQQPPHTLTHITKSIQANVSYSNQHHPSIQNYSTHPQTTILTQPNSTTIQTLAQAQPQPAHNTIFITHAQPLQTNSAHQYNLQAVQGWNQILNWNGNL